MVRITIGIGIWDPKTKLMVNMEMSFVTFVLASWLSGSDSETR